jgi:hypothetical protein
MLRKFIFNYGLVTDGCLSVDPTNDEIIQGVYKKKIREGEERLMLAVLESGVEDFQKYVLARSRCGKKLFQQAEAWLLEKDSNELFSFSNICETLQLHPDYMRQGLLLRKEARLKTLSVEVHRQSRTKSRSTRIRQAPVRPSKLA